MNREQMMHDELHVWLTTAVLVCSRVSGWAASPNARSFTRTAGTRLLVPRSRLDEVKRGIRDAMSMFTVGDPADPNTAIGPMVSQKQYERVQSYTRKGIEE